MGSEGENIFGDVKPQRLQQLSFENPNYTLENLPPGIDKARIDDHLNSNIQPSDSFESQVYQELCDELKVYADLSDSLGGSVGYSSSGSKTSKRWDYSQLTPSTMGVNKVEDTTSSTTTTTTSDCNKTAKEEMNLNLKEEKSKKDTIEINEKEKADQEPETPLPPGWEAHEDNEGCYYWHVKTGTIQRHRPDAPPPTSTSEIGDNKKETTTSKMKQILLDEEESQKIPTTSPSTKKEISTADLVHCEQQQTSASVGARTPISSTSDPYDLQVNVRSLGAIQLNEESLTNENSSKAVNRCIVQLSQDSGEVTVGRGLILCLNEGTLKLIDPETKAVVNSQPIHTIRVWGVGRDDSRDFAYVARDKHSRCHTCHVFRCDVPARTIANRLRDICKKILIERSQSSSKLVSTLSTESKKSDAAATDLHASMTSSTSSIEATASGSGKSDNTTTTNPAPLARPTNFSTKLKTKTVKAPDSFPTPMEEPKKILKAKFLGDLQVDKPGGMDVINAAIATSVEKYPESSWQSINVAVAPSTISVQFTEVKRAAIECRVRFLSFLGIGKEDMRKCAFIVHTAQDTFQAYIFHCEPHAGPLCKTIEAACTLRYQKCLDARPQRMKSPGFPEGATSKSGEAGKSDHGAGQETTLKKALKTIFFGSSSKNP